MDIERFLRLKKQLSTLKEQCSKLQGGREMLLERLSKDFSCSSVSEAKTLLSQLEKEHEEKNRFYSERCSSIEKELDLRCKR